MCSHMRCPARLYRAQSFGSMCWWHWHPQLIHGRGKGHLECGRRMAAAPGWRRLASWALVAGPVVFAALVDPHRCSSGRSHAANLQLRVARQHRAGRLHLLHRQLLDGGAAGAWGAPPGRRPGRRGRRPSPSTRAPRPALIACPAPVGCDQSIASTPGAPAPPLGSLQPPPLPPPAAQPRAAATLQALEKGGQGANSKFTYSCDGHSEQLGWGSMAAAVRPLLSHGGQLPLPQPPLPSSLSAAESPCVGPLPSQPSTTSHQMDTVSWCGGLVASGLCTAAEAIGPPCCCPYCPQPLRLLPLRLHASHHFLPLPHPPHPLQPSWW